MKRTFKRSVTISFWILFSDYGRWLSERYNLAAGEGTSIEKVTCGAVPKELLPISNVPTICFPIEYFKPAGINNILVVILLNGKHSFTIFSKTLDFLA